MRIFLRSLLTLALIVWLGAEVFFPVVAATVFRTLAPDTHTAGTIVGSLLRVLHFVGLSCGVLAIAVLALAPAWGLDRSRTVLASIALLVVMLAATAYSQFGIIPAMDRDRIAAGGAIQNVPASHPAHIHFQQLHKRSERIEQIVLFLGLAVVVLVASAESSPRP
jgi:hypothetical protein